MKRIFLLSFIILMLVGCKDNFDVNDIQSSRKIVVYCFPTVADTTWINVSLSLPVSQAGSVEPVNDARIEYLLNDQPLPVTAMGDGLYCVTGRQQPGDRIRLTVAKDGVEAVSAMTTIPEAVTVKADTVVKVRVFNSYYQDMEDYEQLAATFTDDPKATDYYAVRLEQRSYEGGGSIRKGNTTWHLNYFDPACRQAKWVWEDSICTWSSIGTESENLLHPTSKIDDAFGFSNDFYQDFYIFNDASLAGGSYTLHLNAKEYLSPHGGFVFYRRYRCVLYHLSPEFYRFVKSINDIENNKLAKAGLSQITPTYTNVRGGAGVVAGYNSCVSNWQPIITGVNESSDDILYTNDQTD